MPMSVFTTYLAVAKLQPMRPDDKAPAIYRVGEIAGLPYTTVSRHVRMLGVHRYRKGRYGVGLVETFINLENRREKLVVLTDEGKAIASEFSKLLEDLAH